MNVLRIATLIAAIAGLAGPVCAQQAGKAAAASRMGDAALAQVLANAMTPGEGQKKLEPMIGTFEVKIRTWVDPSRAPIESLAISINSWVLGQRYMRSEPHLVAFPAIAIAMALVGFTFLGDGLRDAFDPKLKGKQ